MAFENFPYTNFHELNLDWIAKIAKDFMEQYTHIQELIANGEQSLQDLTASGLEDLQEKADALEQLLQEWYNTHSEDIANQLADAIQDFATSATNKTNELLSQIPADYTDIFNGITSAFDSTQSYNINDIVWYNDRVYRFTRTHPAGAWTGTDAVVSSVGDILKRYLSAVSPDNDTAGYTDCNTFPANKVIVCLTSATAPANAPYTGYKGVFLTLSNQSTFAIGCQISVSTENEMFFRYGDNVHGFSPWREVTTVSNIKNMLGVVGSWSGNLSGQTNTRIIMEPNKTYIIKRNKPFSYRINIFGYDNVTNYKKWYPYQDFIRFTNDSAARYIVLYDIAAHEEEFDITVYEDNSPALSWSKQTEYYTVNKDSRDGDFTSITECFLALKNNTNPKVIYIDGGDYDIFQEYIDANVPVYTGSNPTTNYYDYCVWTPPNTHIIGRGIVKMIWRPNASEISYNQSHTCSPLNVLNNCFIENIEVYCKNGRYCLHNDAQGRQEYSEKIQRFKNVKFYKELGDTVEGQVLGKYSTIGFSIDAEQRMIFEDCEFYNNTNGRAFYGHASSNTAGTALATQESGSIDIVNCIISSAEGACMRLGCVSNNQLRIRVKIDNTYLSGQIRVTNESESSTPAVQNNFDLTVLNSSDVVIYYADPNNPYPAKVYHA